MDLQIILVIVGIKLFEGELEMKSMKTVSIVIENGKMLTESILFKREQVESSVKKLAQELADRSRMISEYRAQYGFCEEDML